MAKRRRAMPLWLAVLIIAVGAVIAYLQERAEEKGELEPGAIVVSNERAEDRPKRERRPSGGAREQSAEENVALGMPTAAAAGDDDDYLLSRSQYVASFNRSLGIPNWVAWHLDADDIGSAERSQFAPDPDLPDGWERVTPNDYRNSGYDRGHLAPSADRSANAAENRPTFFMTNIIPQAPDNNQGPWADFENYARELAREGNELYVVAGVAGPFSRIAGGKVAVPATTWKAVLVIPEGDDDLGRVTAKSRVIAFAMPNRDGIRGREWSEFATSVDEIERMTGFDLFAALPDDVEAALEARVGR